MKSFINRQMQLWSSCKSEGVGLCHSMHLGILIFSLTTPELVYASKLRASLILGVYAFRHRRPTPLDGMRVVYRTACN